jgi:hypothetical protein
MIRSEQSADFNLCNKLRDTQFPKEYSSLIVRVCSLYGKNLTISELLTIDIDDFAAKRGVGTLYTRRLAKLKDMITTGGIPSDDEHKLPLNLDDETELQSLDLSLKLNKALLPRTYSSLLTRIQSIYGSDLTLKGVMGIDANSFYEMPGVGERYTKKLQDLQTRLAGGTKQQISKCNPSLDLALFSCLEGYVFNGAMGSRLDKRHSAMGGNGVTSRTGINIEKG